MHSSRFDAFARLLGSPRTRRGALRQLGVGGLGGSLLASIGRQQATPLAARPDCTGRHCRCSGGVEGGCDDGLDCCPDNPGLPGGPGRCVRQGRCNQTNCTDEGCACNSGVQDACDDGLVCCADDSSLPGGPGQCVEESACFGQQCQATTNPCPTSCQSDTACSRCCSGYCGSDDYCAAPVCSGAGCECGTGMQQNRCDEGLTCCPSTNLAGGPGVCTNGTCS